MNNIVFTLINLAGSAVLAYLGSWYGSYRASRRATREVEHEEREEGHPS